MLGHQANRIGANHGNLNNHSNLNRSVVSNLNRSVVAKSNAVRSAFNSPAARNAFHNRAALLSPNTRTAIATAAATAAWHHGSGGKTGWWRHPHGGYGWVGPVFWPFAYYDLYDYTLWGYGYEYPFWDYGYTDIYAGLFVPYTYDDLTAYLPRRPNGHRTTIGQAAGPTSSSRAAMPDELGQLCGEDSREVAGLPIDQIQQAIQPNDAQREALDELATASIKAAEEIRAACPTEIALTAPARLAAMQARIEAMIAAVDTVEPTLQKLYELLNDEQRARLNALGQNARESRPSENSLAEGCGGSQSGLAVWPATEIEARVHPTEAQRASLAALQEAAAKAADMLKACPTDQPVTPPARFRALRDRLEIMLQAVTMVRVALDDFYDRLTDEQKAQFELIGPQRSAQASPPTRAATHVRTHHRASLPWLIRHFVTMAGW